MLEKRFWEIAGLAQQIQPETYKIVLRDMLTGEYFEFNIPIITLNRLMQAFCLNEPGCLIRCNFWAPGQLQARWAITYFLGEDSPFESPFTWC